jgi:hypothetical protein
MLSESCQTSGYDSDRTNFLRKVLHTEFLLITSLRNLGELTYNNAKSIKSLTNFLDYPGEEVRYEAAASLLKVDFGNPHAIILCLFYTAAVRKNTIKIRHV